MKSLVFISWLFTCLLSSQIRCQELQIDHVISAYPNLDDTSTTYSKMGFTLKKGRLHENGLINAHIKFSNKTYYELISVQGIPNDSLSKFYQNQINEGSGKGAFLALSGIPTNIIVATLTHLDIKYKVDKTKNWNIISFPEESDLCHIFFIDYLSEFQENEMIVKHPNTSEKIDQVVIEGSANTIAFFESFGFKETIRTKTGAIKIVPKEGSKNRYKVQSITFGNHLGQETIRLDF